MGLTRNLRPSTIAQHAPQNAMDEPDEIARFYDRCSELMRELLDALAYGARRGPVEGVGRRGIRVRRALHSALV